jgi:aarF domain-containing kinase
MRRAVKAIAFTTAGGVATYSAFQLTPESQAKYNIEAYFRSSKQIILAARLGYNAYLDYKANVKPIEASPEFRDELRKFHVRTAKEIYELCSKAKGIYIKFGQYLSTLERILPKDVTDVLKGLQDSCPPHSLKTMEIVLDHEFSNWRDFIKQIDSEPIGAASLAQVHKAVLTDGSSAAIKIQYPELYKQYDLDIKFLSFLTRWASRFLSKQNVTSYDFEGIFNKFKLSIRNEIDFNLEVVNAKFMSSFLQDNPYIKIPDVYEQFSSKRVITMEFVDGIRIDQNDSIKEKLGIDPKQCADLLVDLFGSMIFKTGRIHCDPHPGNILIRKNPTIQGAPQIVLLDHGFYRTLDPDFRTRFVNLWIAIVTQNHSEMKRLATEFGIGDKYRYLPLVFLFKSQNTRKLGANIVKEDVAKIKEQDVLSFSNIYSLLEEFPDDFLLIIRASNLIAMRNVILGGSHRERLLKFTRIAFSEKYKGRMAFYLNWISFRFKLMFYESFFFLYRLLFHVDASII